MKKLTLWILIVVGLFMRLSGQLVQATQTIEVLDYAPGLFYQFYDYAGEGNEFAPFTVTLDYLPDEDGIYQISSATAGTTISYVYQITDEGIYELAYYPESYDRVDLRYEDDSMDDLKSLYFPATMTVGDTFNRGYRQEEQFQVVDLLAEYKIGDISYYNVMVIESVDDLETTMRYYFAPQIGEIYSEFLLNDEFDNRITTSLDILRGPTYE